GNHLLPDLQNTVIQIICKILDRTNARHIIFCGGSAGGFSALAASLRFPDSLALPISPQTSIAKYHDKAVSRYLHYAWPQTRSLSALSDTISHDLVSEYCPGHHNTVAMIQNRRDFFHISNHYNPLQNILARDNSWTLWGNWGVSGDGGHIQP